MLPADPVRSQKIEYSSEQEENSNYDSNEVGEKMTRPREHTNSSSLKVARE